MTAKPDQGDNARRSEQIPLSRVLVGMDGAGRSDDAIRAALFLRSSLNVRLDVVHAVPMPSTVQTALDPEGTDELTAKELMLAIDRLSPRLRDLLGEAGPTPEDLLRVLPGDPDDVLSDYAKEHDVDLVVVGAHERHGLLGLADTAKSLLHRAPCAVWDQMVPFRPVKRLLVPVDMSELSRRALRLAIRLAKAWDAHLEVLHVFQPPSFAYEEGSRTNTEGSNYVVEDIRNDERSALQHMLASCDLDDIKVDVVFTEGDAVDTIVEHASRTELIVMSTHGRTGLARVMMGNVALEIIKSAVAPVLALRRPPGD